MGSRIVPELPRICFSGCFRGTHTLFPRIYPPNPPPKGGSGIRGDGRFFIQAGVES